MGDFAASVSLGEGARSSSVGVGRKLVEVTVEAKGSASPVWGGRGVVGGDGMGWAVALSECPAQNKGNKRKMNDGVGRSGVGWGNVKILFFCLVFDFSFSFLSFLAFFLSFFLLLPRGMRIGVGYVCMRLMRSYEQKNMKIINSQVARGIHRCLAFFFAFFSSFFAFSFA